MGSDGTELVVIAGPTAAGKSEVSLELAGHVKGQVISADSMQVYRYMDIGSAKLPENARRGIRHHLIDVLEPTDDFNVSIFKDMAVQSMERIRSSGDMPIICGGTGFYIQAVINDIDFAEGETDADIRRELEELAEKEGIHHMEDMLQQTDPEYAAISRGNLKRIIRALEYHRLTGKKMSEKNAAGRNKAPAYNTAYIVLTMPRDILYKRIDTRVDAMMRAGFLGEVRKLKDMGVKREMTSMQGLGYRQLYDHLEGCYDLETAVDEIKKQTRHFAKRQLTWFRRERDVTWIDVTQYEDAGEIAEWISTNIIKR